MKLQYGHRKEKIRIDEIERAEIFPSDGSALQVGKEAIIDLHVEYYDALVTSCEAFLPVAKSGYLKLRADGDTSAPSVPTLRKLTDTCDYLFLAFYDDLSRRSAFFASVKVDYTPTTVTLTFTEIPKMGEAGGKHHTVTAENPELSVIDEIELYFDNGDVITLAKKEIISLELEFKKELSVEPYHGYCREAKGGHIRLAINTESIAHHADDQVFLNTKPPTPENLERRIAGAGKSDVDIREIRVKYSANDGLKTYGNTPFHKSDELPFERIIVPDMDEPPYVIIDNVSGAVGEYFGNLYVSGYAKRDTDGTLLIVLGRSVAEA